MELTKLGEEELNSLKYIYGKKEGIKLFEQELNKMTITKKKKLLRI